MEFGDRLKELRKARSLTQEELAEAIYVSRTAVSKWESGRGYPSIDSLKELSRFFSVSIDELVSLDEAIAAAEDDRRAFAGRLSSMVCGMLDILPALPVFASTVGLTILCGACEVVAPRFERPSLNRAFLFAGCALSVTCVAAFIIARQPYAGILCFALLVVKSLVICRRDARPTRP